MKILSLFLILTVMISCSKDSSQGNNQVNGDSTPTEEVIESVSIVFDENLDETNADALVFSLSSVPNSTSVKRIYFTNRSGGNLTLGDLSASLTALRSDLSIRRNRCPSVLRNRRLCYVDIQVEYIDGVSVDDTLYLLPLGGNNETDSANIALVINVNETYAEELSNSGSSIIKSESVLNFGLVTEGESIRRRLYFTNTSSSLSLNTPQFPVLPEGLSLVSSTCGATISRDGGFCYLDFEYSYQGIVGSANSVNESIELISDNMNPVEKSLNIFANNVAAIDPSAPKLNVNVQSFGTNLTIPSTITRRIYINNSLNTPYSFPVDNFVSGANVLKNSCLGNEIKANGTCYIDIQVVLDTPGQEIDVKINLVDANLPDFSIATGGNPDAPTSDVLYDNMSTFGESLEFAKYTGGDANLDNFLAKDTTNGTDRAEIINQQLPVNRDGKVLAEELNQKFNALLEEIKTLD